MRAPPPRRALGPPHRSALPRRRLNRPGAVVDSTRIELDEIPGLLGEEGLDGGAAQAAFRHRPDDASVRLLETLGVVWTISPDAPRCVRACGHPACRRTAAELRRIAELVDEETRRRNLPGVRERVERTIESGIRVVREPLVRYGTPPVTASATAKKCRTDGCENDASSFAAGRGPYAGLCEETCIPAQRDYLRKTNGGAGGASTNGGAPDEEKPVDPNRGCRTVGCENRANAKWARGAFAGLCWEVCVPKMRVRMSDAGKRRVADSSARIIETGHRVPPAAAPEPEPEPEPVEPEPPGEQTLAELAVALEAASAARDAAEDAYGAAAERFAGHSMIRQLQEEGDL